MSSPAHPSSESRPLSAEDLELYGLPLFENADFEAKTAGGADGQGALPKEFWPTYSAMANTDGGRVVLGLREIKTKSGGSRYVPAGIANTEAVQKQLFDGLHNKQITNKSILRNEDVRIVRLPDGRQLIDIHIPRARRQDRPIYIRGNPMTGTYRRSFEGDYLCDEDTVRRMIADAHTDSLDDRILPKFGIEDLDGRTVDQYRRMFRAQRLEHPYNALDHLDFLKAIGAWRRDRQTNEEGLTLGGLLMFGKHQSIVEEVPTYMVDYREIPRSEGETRWTERIHFDGTWSGNVFDFFWRVFQKLTSDISVPFRLEGGQRIADSHVSTALREALVNALIHADYSAPGAILIEKRHDRYVFRNPGALRVPVELAFEGNHSDCRNRSMQQMFVFAGFAERAGSGLPKIKQAWEEQRWVGPSLRENLQPDFTTLVLSMVSLLPEASLRTLRAALGPPSAALSSHEMAALCVADVQGQVSNSGLQTMYTVHPREITKMLQVLVERGLLEPHGQTSGRYYTLAAAVREKIAKNAKSASTDSQPVAQPPPPLVQLAGKADEEVVRSRRSCPAEWCTSDSRRGLCLSP